MLIDSNLIIYAALPERSELREFIREHVPRTSDVSKIEVLGYPNLDPSEKAFFTNFFSWAVVLTVTGKIVDEAIRLRQIRKIKLGDSIIAATALTHDLELLTHNTKDFNWIPGLAVSDPLEEQ
jgi:predicted nucleic acid-binding protein